MINSPNLRKRGVVSQFHLKARLINLSEVGGGETLSSKKGRREKRTKSDNGQDLYKILGYNGT